MHRALRPYLTTGVALVGAAVIVANPVAPPPPDIQIAAPAVTTANVQLAADFATLFADTVANLQLVFDQASFEYDTGAEPPEPTTAVTFTPVLQQIFFNTNDSIQSIIGAIIDAEAPGDIPSDLIDAVVTAITQPIENFLNVAGLVLSPEALRGLAIGLAGPLLSTVFATGEAIENVLDPNTPEDFVPALINFIPTIADGLLNGGYGEVPEFLRPSTAPPGAVVRPGGLLNRLEIGGVPPGSDVVLPGLASTLLTARDSIAEELGLVRADPPALTLTTVTGGEEKQLNNLDTQGTADTVNERKGPVKRILESFKATPGGTAGSLGESSARPRPIKAAVEGFTSTLKSVREGVRDSLGLSPKDTKDDAPKETKDDAPE